MKKVWKKVLALGLNMSMIVSVLPVNAAVTDPNQKKVESGVVQTEDQGEPQTAAVQNLTEGTYQEGQVLVVFKDQIRKERTTDAQIESTAKKVAEDQGMKLAEIWNFAEEEGEAPTGNAGDTEEADDFVVGLMESDTMTTEDMIEKLKSDRSIELAEPNYICHAAGITQDEYADLQWSMSNEGQQNGKAGADGNPDYVWNGATGVVEATTGTDKVIAVIDTGVDYTHTELAENMWENPYQGVLQGEHGFDYVNMDADPMDDNGHGTHCSGIMAAAADNQTGVSGVNKKAKIMALKFLDDSGSGDISDAISAYKYIYQAMRLGVDVAAVNNSWGGGGYSQTLIRVIEKVGALGAVTVFAAGNETTNNDMVTPDDYLEDDSVKAIESPYVINVAAVNEKDEMTQFSNYGKRSVTLGAPGADILSTVSYNCFNPGIYDQELRETLCREFQDYETASLPVYTQNETGTFVADQKTAGIPERIDVRQARTQNRTEASVNVTLSKDSYFGKTGGQGMEVSVTGAKAQDLIYITIPFTQAADEQTLPGLSLMGQALEKNETGEACVSEVAYYVVAAENAQSVVDDQMAGASMLGAYMLENEGSGEYWNHVGGYIPTNSAKEEKEMDLVVQIICTKDGTYTFHMDDFGISKGTDPTENSSFGKYDFYNGTSMAAPYVTGAAALLDAAYDGMGAKELGSLLSGCVRKTAEMGENTSSGGILDLSMLSNPAPIIKDAVFAEKGVLKITGSGFVKDQTTVTVNGKNAAVTVNSDNELIIDGSSYKNKIVEIGVTTPNGTITKEFYLVKGKTAYWTNSDVKDLFCWSKDNLDEMNYRSHAVSDGTDLYFYDARMSGFYEMNRLGMIDENDPAALLTQVYLTPSDGSETLQNDDEYGTLGDAARAGETGTGEDLTEATATLVSNLVYLKGTIYGIKSTESFNSGYRYLTLMAYDTVTDTEKAVEMLPEGYENCTDMSLGAYNGKLYLIGGYDYGKKSLSKKVMVISNPGSRGADWKTAASLPEGRAGGECIQSGNKLYYALGTSVKAGDNGTCPKLLVFDGKKWSVEGGTITPFCCGTVNYGTVSYHTYGGNLGICKDGLQFSGIPCDGLGDSFIYNVTSKKYKATENNCIEEINGDYFLGTVIDGSLFGVKGTSGSVTFAGASVKSGMFKVNYNSSTYGDLEMTKYRYMPGDRITLKVVPNKGYYVKSFQVNGEKIDGLKKSYYAVSDLNVKISYGAYVKKLTMNKTKATLTAGKTLSLSVKVAPKSAGNKNVTWKSSNTKYATVNSKGKVTAKKAGAGKTVTITATAKDGSKVKASCKVTIKKAAKKK